MSNRGGNDPAIVTKNINIRTAAEKVESPYMIKHGNYLS